MKQFKVGDRVTWESQSSGYTTAKVGGVVAVVKAGRVPCLDDLTVKLRRVGVYGMSRKEDSYLVDCDGIAYWPRVKNLQING